MQRVSSNITLLLRLFVPVFFGVFFGALTLFIWFADREYFGNLPGPTLRLVISTVMILFIAVVWLTFWRLRRVEMDTEWVYVTDYIKSARYPWSNIKHIHEHSLGLFGLVSIELDVPGRFGRKVWFLASGSTWKPFREEHAGLLLDKYRS